MGSIELMKEEAPSGNPVSILKLDDDIILCPITPDTKTENQTRDEEDNKSLSPCPDQSPKKEPNLTVLLEVSIPLSPNGGKSSTSNEDVLETPAGCMYNSFATDADADDKCLLAPVITKCRAMIKNLAVEDSAVRRLDFETELSHEFCDKTSINASEDECPVSDDSDIELPTTPKQSPIIITAVADTCPRAPIKNERLTPKTIDQGIVRRLFDD